MLHKLFQINTKVDLLSYICLLPDVTILVSFSKMNVATYN